MAEKVTARELRQYLKERSHEDLVADIAELFARLDGVKDYYQIRLGGGHSEAVVEKYKAIIEREFFPSRGMGMPRLSVARKAVTDYKKVAASVDGLIDLMIYYVETGVRYTNAYGDIDEPFYNSMESMYASAVKLIGEHRQHARFEPRCRTIVRDTRNIGWGFHDSLSDIYGEGFEA